ncbi:MAG: hypothetical protein AVDCRST_MAG18-2972, partial [uncultured Thermomicrobiales bacterium]
RGAGRAGDRAHAPVAAGPRGAAHRLPARRQPAGALLPPRRGGAPAGGVSVGAGAATGPGTGGL